MAETFRSAFTKEELISGDQALIAGEMKKLGEFKVEAGQMISVGWGDLDGQQSAQGRIYVDLKSDANAALNGKLRLVVYSPQNRPLEILGEYRTETLRTNVADRTLQVPFPEDDLWISEDKKLRLEFACDSAATLSKANSTFIMDITEAVV